MNSELLTIVIPTRDRADLLALCLRSVFEQQERVPRVIVSDNSSRDDARVAALRERYRFDYVRQPGVLRMVDHHNAALDLAQTEWALLLHDDDELYPNVLGPILSFLAHARDAGLVLGGTQFIDDQSQPHGAWIPEEPLQSRGEEAVLRLGLDFTAYPPSCIWNLAAFRREGGFPDANGAGADYTLVLRLANAYGVALFPQILGRYRVGPHQSTGYSTPERASATLECSITMAEMTRNIGVSRQVADQLVDYMIWWIFRIVAATLLDTHPFFVSRMCRRCRRATPPHGRWRSRLRAEYPFLFWHPNWLWTLGYFLAMRSLPALVRRRLWFRRAACTDL